MNSPSNSCSSSRGRLVAGGVLLTVAVLALLSRHLSWSGSGRALLPVIGVAFVVWGALARNAGLLVPGGILLGVGVGSWLQPTYGTGAFLFAMAGGFLSISLFSVLLFGPKQRAGWTIFPALGLAFAGLVVAGGAEMRALLRTFGDYWPYALLIVALALIASAWGKKS
jgi:hypothetical protein